MSYLFRSILAVPSGNLILMLILNLIIISIVTLFYRQLQAIPFDKNSAFVVGVQVDKLYLLLIGMVALTVVITMRIVGLIMVIALLSIPPGIAGLFVKELKRMMLLSSLFSVFFTTSRLTLSYSLNLTSDATIILVAGISYFLALMGKRWAITNR